MALYFLHCLESEPDSLLVLTLRGPVPQIKIFCRKITVAIPKCGGEDLSIGLSIFPKRFKKEG